jgi:hypothetical protein
VRIEQAAVLETPGIRELIRAAIAEAERPEGKAGKPRTVVHKAPPGRAQLQAGHEPDILRPYFGCSRGSLNRAIYFRATTYLVSVSSLLSRGFLVPWLIGLAWSHMLGASGSP